MKVKTEIDIQIPSIPNYILFNDGAKQNTLPISAFSEEELRAIGAQWTEELVKKSKRKVE